MITKDQAMALGYGDELHYTGKRPCTRHVGPRGGVTVKVTRVRVTGRCQTWKTRPSEFRLPVKYGMREYSAVTHGDAHCWHLPGECPLELEKEPTITDEERSNGPRR